MHFTNIFNKEFKQELDDNFSSIVTENVGPFLYSVVKTIRPRTVLEIGAGYTSMFFAKALSEIEDEDKFDLNLMGDNSSNEEWVRRKNLLNPNYFSNEESKLLIIDTFNRKNHDNARPVEKALKNLNLNRFVEIINCDARDLNSMDAILLKYPILDFVFLDFGGGVELPIFFKFFFETLLNDFGGCLMVHSTATNLAHRLWLAELKLKYQGNPTVEIFTFFEPNKIKQNSFTLVKKTKDTDTGEYNPPIFTAWP